MLNVEWHAVALVAYVRFSYVNDPLVQFYNEVSNVTYVFMIHAVHL